MVLPVVGGCSSPLGNCALLMDSAGRASGTSLRASYAMSGTDLTSNVRSGGVCTLVGARPRRHAWDYRRAPGTRISYALTTRCPVLTCADCSRRRGRYCWRSAASWYQRPPTCYARAASSPQPCYARATACPVPCYARATPCPVLILLRGFRDKGGAPLVALDLRRSDQAAPRQQQAGRALLRFRLSLSPPPSLPPSLSLALPLAHRLRLIDTDKEPSVGWYADTESVGFAVLRRRACWLVCCRWATCTAASTATSTRPSLSRSTPCLPTT
eukprot:419294-Rhodomonas_salina.1